MPLYEYECTKCHEQVEVVQKFSDAPLTDCPKCNTAGVLQKKMSMSSFSLKGTGWYTTDYKKSGGGGSSQT